MILIRGANIEDTVFTSDAGILGFEVTWNVTRIQRDADAGRFGMAQTIPMSVFPPMNDAMRSNIDWSKVKRIALDDEALAAPILMVCMLNPENDGAVIRVPVDGNHRLCARRLRGFDDFYAHIVTPRLEPGYRVTEEVVEP